MTEIAPGFRKVSGTRSPPKDERKYYIMLRTGFVDTRVAYAAEQLVWKHGGHSGDVIAVREA